MIASFTRTLLLSSFLTLPFSVQAAPETYSFDPNHTNITWHANHIGFSYPSGKFTDAKGTIEIDEAKPENSKVDVTINMASITTGLPKFDDHLKNKDFFNITQFPTARFVSKKVEVTGKQTAKLHGDLTLLNVTKPVVLEVTLNKIGPNPFNQKKTAGFSATTTIKRSEFGINYALPAVSDEVRLGLEIEAIAAQ